MRSGNANMQCRCAIVAFALAWCCSATAVAQARERSKPAPADAPSKLAEFYQPQIDAALKAIAEGEDATTSIETVQRLFDEIIVRAETTELELFRDAAAAKRLTSLVTKSPDDTWAATMGMLLEVPEFAQALAFTARGGDEELQHSLTLAQRLYAKHGDRINIYANLAAAICVVHDKPLKRRINENSVEAPDPLALFEYYMANDDRMAFGVRNMPADLLVFVVDSTASIEEMNWALGKYAGTREIGKLFFAIDYDYNHYQKGTPKKVTQEGFNLPNIARYGGVCADQAYFACSVGKALGIPSTYTVGASGEVSHAWVGYLESNKRAAWWNFDSGRYEAYQGVRGVVADPVTGMRVPDSSIALLAEYATAPELNRYACIAMSDAATRLLLASTDADGLAPAEPGANDVAPIRAAHKDDALALIEAALRTCPGYADAWFTVSNLAREGDLSLDEKKKWATVLHRLCGEKYPDFYFAVVAPMIDTVDDVNEQNALWNAAFRTFQKRHDLAAAVRMRQAAMWRTHGDRAKAGQCCEDVIERYANAGPFVLEAMKMATDLLVEMEQSQRIPALYQKAWSLTKKPGDMANEFAVQSNWYRIGKWYADTLASNGRTQEANDVRTAIGAK